MSNKLIKAIKDPKKALLYAMNKGLFDFLSDKAYLKLRFRLIMGRKPDLNDPTTYNEKLQWLKLNNRRAEYTMMVDKYRVREYIAKTIGEEYLIPLIGIWDREEDIDFEKLPERFVLKCNHNSGLGMYICRDKSKLDVEKVRKELRRGMEQNYYLRGREWPYKNVPRKIIAEQFMEDASTGELRDYKFFCFDGRVKALFVATERQKLGEEVKFDYFDAEYNHLNLKQEHPNAKHVPEKPLYFDKMKELAEKISRDIPHLRVDFYEANGKIYFGECTFYHLSGMAEFYPNEWDEIFGSWLKLPNNKEE